MEVWRPLLTWRPDDENFPFENVAIVHKASGESCNSTRKKMFVMLESILMGNIKEQHFGGKISTCLEIHSGMYSPESGLFESSSNCFFKSRVDASLDILDFFHSKLIRENIYGIFLHCN